ncbi:hypothetical protein LMG10661_02678 [Ralstonia syzygii subsp. syzygii]|nr:hypothetical protein LMG10661_02678 [Ralstonia syzygii subsp. syzygii]
MASTSKSIYATTPTWSCTHETTVEDAFALGYQDAADTLDRHAIALR